MIDFTFKKYSYWNRPFVVSHPILLHILDNHLKANILNVKKNVANKNKKGK